MASFSWRALASLPLASLRYPAPASPPARPRSGSSCGRAACVRGRTGARDALAKRTVIRPLVARGRCLRRLASATRPFGFK